MRRVYTAILAVCLLAACGRERGSEQQPLPSLAAHDPWTPMSEAALTARISEARELAKHGERQVLLVFIADWCTDCHEVVRLGDEQPARSVLARDYVVVHVEVGRFDRHVALLKTHEVDRIATLVVLDPSTGERVTKTSLEPLTGEDRGLSSSDLAAWLQDPSA